jgi:2,3-bisphosphoglycerate-dependent phosphoglycerate mutase
MSDPTAPTSSTPEAGGHRLILLRHGQSEYNAANLFTGWADPPLTALGEREAVRAGRAVAAAGCPPAVAHTSLLVRAIATTRLVLAAADRADVTVRGSWRLNGRHYGALQGRDKDLVRQEFGTELVERWRRSYRERPPELRDDPNAADPRYAGLPPEVLPHTESLCDALTRILPYWFGAIVPDLRRGRTVLVVAHGNTLRALIKHLDRIPVEAVPRLEIPTARPLLYQLDADLRPLIPGGRRLDLGPALAARETSGRAGRRDPQRV